MKKKDLVNVYTYSSKKKIFSNTHVYFCLIINCFFYSIKIIYNGSPKQLTMHLLR